MGSTAVQPVVLSSTLGKKWWHIPDGLWRRRASVRDRRLDLTIRRHILPLLKQVEALQRKDYPNAPLFLKGKTAAEIAQNPMTLEIALYMYEAAMSKGLICYVPGKHAQRVSIHRGGALELSVGSCGISPNDVVRKYFGIIAADILVKSGHDPKDLGVYLSSTLQCKVGNLNRLRTLCLLNRDAIAELRSALGSLDLVMEKDKKWLAILGRADVKHFIRPLNDAMRRNFPEMLDWSEALLEAFVENLKNEVQIRAIGPSIAAITNPEIVKAIGSWPTAVDESGRLVCRIQQIKDMLGEELFESFIQGSPALVKDLGTWPQQKIEVYKPYLAFMTGPALEVMSRMEDHHRLAVLAGLVDKFDAVVIRKSLKTKDGLLMLRGLVDEITAMNHNTPQTAVKIKKLIAGTYFDALFASYMKQDGI